MKNLERLRKICDILTDLDSNKSDRNITLKEYESLLQKNKDNIHYLVNNKSFNDWNEFKKIFVEQQEELGFKWIPIRGQSGPISLIEIALTENIGKELAAFCMLDKKIEEGNFDEIIRSNISELYAFLRGEDSIVDYSAARDGFKSFSDKNHSYKFSVGRNSQKFKKAINEYSYRDKDIGINENELGKQISDKIRKMFSLDIIDHSQLKRGAGKYQNVDIEGIRISRQIDHDRFLMYNFELKATNKISSISEAISQAINYKSYANFTYIIIPLFDQNTFFDTDRLEGLVELCEKNEIGIVSININTNNHEIIDLNEVLKAPYRDIESPDRIKEIIEDKKRVPQYEACPLCRKIVNKSERKNCGWLIVNGGDSFCMKEQMEKMFMK